jgi:hypothetical protein
MFLPSCCQKWKIEVLLLEIRYGTTISKMGFALVEITGEGQRASVRLFPEALFEFYKKLCATSYNSLIYRWS